MTARSPTEKKRKSPRQFGMLRRLPSGNYQARYLGADGKHHSDTFPTSAAANAWLSKAQTELASGKWVDPKLGKETFGEYADQWLADRTLKPRTRQHYRSIIDTHLVPAFGVLRLNQVSKASVKAWHRKMTARGTPTMTAHAYSLLRSILGTAVTDDLIGANPCVISGASNVKHRASTTVTATPEQLQIITAAMPARLRAMVSLASDMFLRFGELAELRRMDIDLDRRLILIRRGVVRVTGEGAVVGDPKSEAGKRDRAIPPHLIPVIKAHLAEHVGPEEEALLFPGPLGGNMHPRWLYEHWHPARQAAGRPDLRFHDLRHTGATAFARIPGVTTADIMHAGGWTTPQVAMRYQSTDAERQQELARKLSRTRSRVAGDVVPIKGRSRS